MKSTRATQGIPFISGELEAFTTTGRMRARVEEIVETVPVPPTPSSWPSEASTHCHHPGMESLSLPPAKLHTRTSLQLPVPDREKGDPKKYSSVCLICSNAEKNAGERQSLQWTRQSPPSPTGPPPNHRDKCSFASPNTTPHTSPAQKQGAKPTVLCLENCVPFPKMQSFGLYISKKRTRDTKQMGKCIQIHNKAKNSHAAIPDPNAFIDMFSCPPRTSPWPQPAPADCPLCAGDLFTTLGFCSLPFTHHSAPACPLLHSKLVPPLVCFSRNAPIPSSPSPSPDDCPAAWMEQKPQKRASIGCLYPPASVCSLLPTDHGGFLGAGGHLLKLCVPTFCPQTYATYSLYHPH